MGLLTSFEPYFSAKEYDSVEWRSVTATWSMVVFLTMGEDTKKRFSNLTDQLEGFGADISSLRGNVRNILHHLDGNNGLNCDSQKIGWFCCLQRINGKRSWNGSRRLSVRITMQKWRRLASRERGSGYYKDAKCGSGLNWRNRLSCGFMEKVVYAAHCFIGWSNY